MFLLSAIWNEGIATPGALTGASCGGWRGVFHRGEGVVHESPPPSPQAASSTRLKNKIQIKPWFHRGAMPRSSGFLALLRLSVTWFYPKLGKVFSPAGCWQPCRTGELGWLLPKNGSLRTVTRMKHVCSR